MVDIDFSALYLYKINTTDCYENLNLTDVYELCCYFSNTVQKMIAPYKHLCVYSVFKTTTFVWLTQKFHDRR